MMHTLKCWPAYYEAVKSGQKNFEIRKNDRPFVVGDTMLLREWDPGTKQYTGREAKRKITYILDLSQAPGLENVRGYVVIGVREEGL